MKTILIFGAGWLGKEFIEAIESSKRKIIVATRDPLKKFNNPNIEVIQISFHTLSGAVEFKVQLTQKIDEILVMLPPSHMVNYEHTIASICAQFPSLDHFIYTSSTGVYQETSDWVFEDSALKKAHPVVLAEKHIRNYYPKFHTILRLAGLIGNDRHPVLYFLKKKMNLNGNAPVNLIHRKDIINALIILLEDPYPGVYNLCYPAHPTKKEYYNEIARKLFQIELQFESKGSGKMISGSKFALTFNYNYQFDINEIEVLDKLNKDNK